MNYTDSTIPVKKKEDSLISSRQDPAHAEDSQKSNHRFAIVALVITNFLFVNFSFFILNYLKRDTLVLETNYFALLLVFNFIWLINSIYFKKFNIQSYPNYKNLFITLAKSNIVLLYMVSIIIVVSGFYEYSRIHIFGSTLLLAICELILFSIFYYTQGRSIYNRQKEDENLTIRYLDFSFSMLLVDFALLMGSFFIVNYLKRDTFILNPDYEILMMLVIGVWLVSSLATRKFVHQRYRNIWYAGAPAIKAAILMATASAMIVFAFRMFEFSRLQLFGSLLLLLVLESIVFIPYYLSRLKSGKKGDVEKVEDVKAMLLQELLPLELKHIKSHLNRNFEAARQKLQDLYLKSEPKLFEMLEDSINLGEHDKKETVVINTHTMYNIEVIEDHTLSLIINLHKINDIRWLNRYFLEVHKKIYNGGYFVGRAHTIGTHKKHIFNKFPKFIASAIYPLDFFWRRIFPKIPLLKQVYFIITRGQNRVFSKAEILGRLSFCGFKIISTKEFNENFYFIGQRRKTPSVDRNPSYGPTIKLRRIGLDGKIIHIHKLRTMHPYSEYLQDFIYDQNKLNKSGKFENDFRLTEWGKLFRTLWIDELPQLVNYVRGEVNLVGVRALSEHYFNLYPEDLRDLRTQFKPGLVPPYYADMPKNFEEIVESERQYLIQKKARPLITDIYYFFKALNNILFKHARSQ